MNRARPAARRARTFPDLGRPAVVDGFPDLGKPSLFPDPFPDLGRPTTAPSEPGVLRFDAVGRALGLAAILMSVAACEGEGPSPVDAGGPDPDSGPPLALGDIEVTVEADVERFAGRLSVGAFLSETPTSPPLAQAREMAPTFPLEVTLRGLEPGRYWVIAVLDADPPSPTLPGPEDRSVTSMAVDVRGDDHPALSLRFDRP